MFKETKDGNKRRSFFGRPSLSGHSSQNSNNKNDEEPANMLRKRRTSSLITNLAAARQSADDEGFHRGTYVESPASPARPQFPQRASGGNRPGSVFGSLKSVRSHDADDLPLSATSARTAMSRGSVDDVGRIRGVIQHGEVQTSSSMFRKKKEYLVLTETQLIRFKSHQKAAETFPGIPSPFSRASVARHSQTPSTGSLHELQEVASETSGDRDLGTPLRQIVAVYHLDDGRPYFAIEIVYLDDETNHASSMTLQFGDPGDMYSWLASIRETANRVRLADSDPLSAFNSYRAARVVEAERDYVPPNYAIYKVVQRPLSKTGVRSSSDDLAKVGASVCFLAIGVHKVHLIQLPKGPTQRSSSPSLVTAGAGSHASYGILTLTELRVSETDDTFELTFRTPLLKPKKFQLASLASHDIALRLRHVEEHLRPEWESRPYHFIVPDDVKYDILSRSSEQPIDQDSLDRTLIGYCVAYGVKPDNIRYQITYPAEDYPRFELLPPVGLRRNEYTALELLAVMRSLRYNEGFAGISFKDVRLDALNGLKDHYGAEHLCTKTKRGTSVQMEIEEQGRSCLLVQEIRALALTSRKLRRMDFSSCITRRPRDTLQSPGSKSRDMGCGIVEALFPLCKYQTTNVDWIILNNIPLGETDLDYLVAAAVERVCHFRALEMSNCGLTDRAVSLILDSLRAQENTLEALDLSRNACRLSHITFDSQIGVFGFLTKLNLSHLARTSGPESFISVETFQAWRLQELILSGTSMSSGMVDAIASYLVNYRQSSALHELKLDHCYLTGKDVAYLLHSMTEEPGKARELHLDVSENYIEQHLDALTSSIASGLAPSSLTIRLMEFDDEADFRKMVLALAKNNTIRNLDISRASLPCDASEETCQAMEKMFAENSTLEYLDISGEDSRLETTKLGVGINKALRGLQRNHSLKVLFIQFQKLGLQGASTLADVLKVNNTLTELHCENNGIALSGFTDLVNALHRNTTLLYLPPMQESRQTALKQTEDQVKSMRDDTSASAQNRSASVRNKISNKVSGKAAKEKTSSMLLSDQDIKAALSLVDESWGRQIYRLQQYLQRNFNIANGIPTALEVDDEEFERPDTATSLSRIVEKVKFDSTPTVEKQLQLGEKMMIQEEDDDDTVSDMVSERTLSIKKARTWSINKDFNKSESLEKPLPPTPAPKRTSFSDFQRKMMEKMDERPAYMSWQPRM
ncbi:leucine rich repeat protein-like protein [Delitschia confertaspora ATCC 74209]|uniref:Leucine rich repeat protein-like protein n=1 Tax=Delitschia confertaspora ATCC 74209 TaxID=1513339 RepID=A0A9P4K0F0_9PLEO|nr:leucine rich repeat protein-like protein [Delitschia confertaspora ATCC 74209]